MSVESNAGWWVAPVGRGVWVPSGMRHAASYSEASEVLLLKIAPAQENVLSAAPLTIAVTDLLYELALEMCRITKELGDPAYGVLVARLILHHLQRSPAAPFLFLPGGHDPRLVRVMNILRAQPGRDVALEALALEIGSSTRTIARLFTLETGMTFGRWRDQLRVLTAVDRMTKGASITRVALDLGYQSQSSFSTMFTRIIGMPPGRFLHTVKMDREARAP